VLPGGALLGEEGLVQGCEEQMKKQKHAGEEKRIAF